MKDLKDEAENKLREALLDRGWYLLEELSVIVDGLEWYGDHELIENNDVFEAVLKLALRTKPSKNVDRMVVRRATLKQKHKSNTNLTP